MNASLAIFAALAVRNPFWPVGYEGERESISADNVVAAAVEAAETDVSRTAAEDAAEAAAQAAAEAAEAAKAAAEPVYAVSDAQWRTARAALRVSGRSVAVDPADGSRRTGVTINGYTYGDGDLISINHDGCRFTWRVHGLDGNNLLRLERLRARRLEQ